MGLTFIVAPAFHLPTMCPENQGEPLSLEHSARSTIFAGPFVVPAAGRNPVAAVLSGTRCRL